MLLTRREILGGAAAIGALSLAPWARAMAGRLYRCPITLERSRVVLEAAVAGRSLRFLIDTGAPWSLIDNELAKTLKFRKLPGRRQIVGVGGISEFPWYDAGEIRFGGDIRVPHMLFVGARSGGFGPNIVGTFGSGLFTSYDSDLDFARGEWRSYPDGRPDFAGLSHLPSRFIREADVGDRIEAQATVGGFAGDFLLDTGMPGEVMLDSRAAAKSGFWSDARPYVPLQARGLGKNTVPGRLIKLDRLKIGPFVFEDPLVRLDKPGTASLREHEGVIGLGSLRLLNLTTQVSTRTLWAAPSGVPRPPRDYPMSGLWLDGEGTQVTIDDVGTGSPAAAAGLKVGDKVIGQEIRALIGKITGPPGTQVPLTVERGGVRRDVMLTLAPYL
ncbi:MAG: aspartyl protease family protein [Pseudomonadota bacterium]